MKYMGSKNRIAKHLVPIMLAERKPHQYWVEPFVGGANIIDKVPTPRLGYDKDFYLIEALRLIRDNSESLPKNKQEFTEYDYKRVRDEKHKFDDGIVGYVGYALSYGGKWFGGWRRDKKGKRDYVKEAYKNAIKQSERLQDVELYCGDYKIFQYPPNSLIYCDPPYANATSYKNKFDHALFWDWCRKMVHRGHTVFVSEYDAPDDFECIWQKEITSSLTKNTGSKKGIEKLFKFKGDLK